MDVQNVFDIIVRHTREVVPGLEGHTFQFSNSLQDLGANSVDRSEILLFTLESLSLRVPLSEFSRAANMGELARLIHAKL